MKQLLFLGFLLGSLAHASSEPAVTAEVSRMHCLVQFVQMLVLL